MNKIKIRTFSPLKAEKIREAVKLLNENLWTFIDLKLLGGEDKFLLIYTENNVDGNEPKIVEKKEVKVEEPPIEPNPIKDFTAPPPIQDIKKYESHQEQVKSEEPKNKMEGVMGILNEYKLMIIIGVAIIILIYIITKG